MWLEYREIGTDEYTRVPITRSTSTISVEIYKHVSLEIRIVLTNDAGITSTGGVHVSELRGIYFFTTYQEKMIAEDISEYIPIYGCPHGTTMDYTAVISCCMCDNFSHVMLNL